MISSASCFLECHSEERANVVRSHATKNLSSGHDGEGLTIIELAGERFFAPLRMTIVRNPGHPKELEVFDA